MYEKRNQVTEKILDLTLEIIYLLTGEEHMVVKKPVGYTSHSNSPWVFDKSIVPPLHSLIHERNNDHKILELTSQITQLLTGEVPIRCEDFTVYFSTEEWEYLGEHKDLYEDMDTGNHWPLSSLETFVSGEFHMHFSLPDFGNKYVTGNKTNNGVQDQKCSEQNIFFTKSHESASYTEGTLTKYLSTHIKKEAALSEVENLTNPDICPPMVCMPTKCTSTHSKKESTFCIEGNFIDMATAKPTEVHTEYTVIHVKDEPASYREGNLIDTFVRTSTEHKLTEYQSTCIKDELVSCEEGNTTKTEICAPAEYKSTSKSSEFGTVMLIDADNYTLTEHTQKKDTFTCIAGYLEGCTNAQNTPANLSLTESRKPGNNNYNDGISPQNIGKVLHCHKWPERFNINSKIVQHQPDNKGGTMDATEIGPVVFTEAELVTQERNPKEDKGFSCSECGKNFRLVSYLTKHKRSHTGEKPFKCNECGKCFSLSEHLVSHRKIHTGIKPFNCTECDKWFTQAAHLASHKRIHTGIKPFNCTECGKCFTQAAHLTSHKRIHTGEKPFQCSECGKCFTWATQLASHKSVHTGVKPFKCTECGECFSWSFQLASHKWVHTGEKPFKCTECEKCFAQAKLLALHKRIHTGEKPYKCTECGKCFTQAAHLASHKRIHTGEKPFFCSECGKCYTDRSGLTKHQRNHRR
ncbi:oocyte zinc finger protein XlCOF22-like [Pelobates fuscus]|uniref:oocyte zinc finger protein XlCOF22-like n=1 Tax=Pelobates fuscus TaxID=191477 RepID=UPI002FE4EADE